MRIKTSSSVSSTSNSSCIIAPIEPRLFRSIDLDFGWITVCLWAFSSFKYLSNLRGSPVAATVSSLCGDPEPPCAKVLRNRPVGVGRTCEGLKGEVDEEPRTTEWIGVGRVGLDAEDDEVK